MAKKTKIQQNIIITSRSYKPRVGVLKTRTTLFLTRKSQLHSVICNEKGVPDYLAINIYYDTLRSWYTPNKIKKEDGKVVHISKLKTKGIYLSYNELAKTHGCSTETIRRKLVKLENLGLIQRSYKHKETVATKSYNQLIVYVWKQTPHFYNSYGVDHSEIKYLKPQTNYKYIVEKYNVDYHAKIENIKTIKDIGGIHKNVDTKELIEFSNKLEKSRSRANFEKKYFSEANSNTQTNSKIEEGTNKSLNYQSITKENTYPMVSNNSVSSVSKNTKKQEITNNSNEFLGSGKFLSEMLEDLTEDMCEIIRSNCGRNFTNRAIKEIAKAVSRSKKGSKAFFYHIKGFIAYLSKILRFEKRDPEKISGDNYYITSNQTEEEQDIKKQEKYLSEIEYSLQVSPEWHLKKKLAAVLERAKAYDVLTSFKSLDIKQNKALITVNKHIELSKEDKNIILNQIRATHERVDDKGNIEYIESFEIITPDRSTTHLDSSASPIELDQGFLKREGIWDKVREKFATLEGDAIEKSWTARLKADIDKNNNTINLIAPTPFIRDWINSNYLFKLESIAKDFGYNIDSIRL